MAVDDVRFTSHGCTLCGTLTLPDVGSPAATVLMIHGSGPLDRDANMAGQRLNIFNTLAEALGRAQIASFRYDKRGCGKSEGDFATTGFHDLIDDATAAFDAAAERTPGLPIVVVGHSEGTLIAPVVAARRPRVAGLVLVCPTVAPVEATLLAQAEQLAKDVRGLRGLSGSTLRFLYALGGGPVAAQRKLIQRARTTGRATLGSGSLRICVKWLRELLAHDAHAWIGRVATPMLCVCGGKDLQCDPEDGHRIVALAKTPVEVHVVSDLTHILRRDAEPPSFPRYGDLIAKPMDLVVAELAREWILRQTRFLP